jgi:hypothetical protein
MKKVLEMLLIIEFENSFHSIYFRKTEDQNMDQGCTNFPKIQKAPLSCW